jgi:DNA-binding transcriptional ArsR family regulator
MPRSRLVRIVPLAALAAAAAVATAPAAVAASPVDVWIGLAMLLPGCGSGVGEVVTLQRPSRTFNETVDRSGDGDLTLVSTNGLKDQSNEVSMAVDELSRIFAALADPTRRDMVTRLAAGDATANQLAEPYQISLQAVYKHLKVLEDAGVVSRPPGPQPRPVRLEAEVFDLMDKWIERYRRQAEERYRRLDVVLAQQNETETGNEEQKGRTA